MVTFVYPMKLSSSDKALLISITGASLLVLVFFFLGVKPYQGAIAEEFIEIPVISEIEEPELQEIEKTPQSQRPAKISHQIYNASDLKKEAKSLEEEDAIRKAIEAQKLHSVENLNAENESRLEALQAEQKAALESKKKEVQAAIDAREATRNKKKKSAYRQSTVGYSLEGRTALKIPNPVYTCDARGIIVINITVNGQGVITKKEYNKQASTSTNGCLIDQAMDYLSRAYFDNSSKPSQIGTVTYDFQG